MGLLSYITSPRPAESRREHRRRVRSSQSVGKRSSSREIRRAYNSKYRSDHWFYK